MKRIPPAASGLTTQKAVQKNSLNRIANYGGEHLRRGVETTGRFGMALLISMACASVDLICASVLTDALLQPSVVL